MSRGQPTVVHVAIVSPLASQCVKRERVCCEMLRGCPLVRRWLLLRGW